MFTDGVVSLLPIAPTIDAPNIVKMVAAIQYLLRNNVVARGLLRIPCCNQGHHSTIYVMLPFITGGIGEIGNTISVNIVFVQFCKRKYKRNSFLYADMIVMALLRIAHLCVGIQKVRSIRIHRCKI